jgi:hypothetical protein
MARSLEMMNDDQGCKFYFVSTHMASVWPWTNLQVDTWLLLAHSSKSKRFVSTSVYIHRCRALLRSSHACTTLCMFKHTCVRHGVDSVKCAKGEALSLVVVVLWHGAYHLQICRFTDTNSAGLLTMSLDSSPKVLFRYLDKSGSVADVDEERVECEASFRLAMTRAGTYKCACASAPSDAGRMRTRKKACSCIHSDTHPRMCVYTQQVRQIRWSPARWWPRY